jgi:hypothetical protein
VLLLILLYYDNNLSVERWKGRIGCWTKRRKGGEELVVAVVIWSSSMSHRSQTLPTSACVPSLKLAGNSPTEPQIQTINTSSSLSPSLPFTTTDVSRCHRMPVIRYLTILPMCKSVPEWYIFLPLRPYASLPHPPSMMKSYQSSHDGLHSLFR